MISSFGQGDATVREPPKPVWLGSDSADWATAIEAREVTVADGGAVEVAVGGGGAMARVMVVGTAGSGWGG